MQMQIEQVVDRRLDGVTVQTPQLSLYWNLVKVLDLKSLFSQKREKKSLIINISTETPVGKCQNTNV